MSTAELLLRELHQAGIRLEVNGGGLKVRGKGPRLTEAQRARLQELKDEIIRILPSAKAHAAALEAWTQAVETMATIWAEHARQVRQEGREPAWLDDQAYHDQIDEAVTAGDVAEVRRIAEEWEAAWRATTEG